MKKVLYPLLRKYVSSYREFLELIRENGRDNNLYSPRFQKLIKLEDEVRGILMILKEENLVEYERGRYSLSEGKKNWQKNFVENKFIKIKTVIPRSLANFKE